MINESLMIKLKNNEVSKRNDTQKTFPVHRDVTSGGSGRKVFAGTRAAGEQISMNTSCRCRVIWVFLKLKSQSPANQCHASVATQAPVYKSPSAEFHHSHHSDTETCLGLHSNETNR